MPIITEDFYSPYYNGYYGIPTPMYGPWYPIHPSYFPFTGQVHYSHQTSPYHQHHNAIYTPFNVGHGGAINVAPTPVGHIHVPTTVVPVIPGHRY
ncbi:hypothetical protein [Cytobacillus sp.]|uniref:hypothetical protein n=1 Tax=Cytobacillus sp. TaxID=2675269 RepID=UPI0028BD4E7A|nr:hypothetical protein [Cytobacillus sp.]